MDDQEEEFEAFVKHMGKCINCRVNALMLGKLDMYSPRCILYKKPRKKSRILTQGRVSILLGTVVAILMYLSQGLSPYVMVKVWLTSVSISVVVSTFKKLPRGNGWHGLGGPVQPRLNPYPVARIKRMPSCQESPLFHRLQSCPQVYPDKGYTKPRQLNGRLRRGW